MGAVAVGRIDLASVDAVTIDAYGTLLQLRDPVERLRRLVPDRDPAAVAHAFGVEAGYYAAHAEAARDEATLAALHAECTRVFNDELGSSLTPAEYVGALEFELLPGVVDALRRLRALGLALAVVANWDFSLHTHLERAGLTPWFETVVVSAELGVRKPDALPFLEALRRLHVPAERAVHVGDDPATDEAGARAARMRFAPAPLTTAVAAWR